MSLKSKGNVGIGKDRPRVLCISCDAAYSLNSKFITIHETIELPTNKGKLVRFSCSKGKGETWRQTNISTHVKPYYISHVVVVRTGGVMLVHLIQKDTYQK